MKLRKILTIGLVIFLLVTLVYIISGIKGKTGVDYKVESRPDGEGIVFSSFNKENRKALEIKCKEFQEETKDKILMRHIEGLIYKKGRMNKDIKVFGDDGYVDNNYHNFFIEKNARLVSEDFVIFANSFTLKERAEMRSSPNVTYQTRALNGQAVGGMDFYLNINILKLYDTRGTYKRDDRTFNFKTSVLWIMEPDKVVVLESDSEIRDDRSILRSDWITMKFTEDFKHILEASSQKNSYLYAEDRETNEIKEIKAENVHTRYDGAGHVTQMIVVKDAQILLKDNDNHTLVASDLVEMNFDPDSGKLKNVKLPHRSRVDNTGKNRFKVIADTSFIDYDKKGEIRYCEGSGSVHFVADDYRGVTDKIKYEIAKNSMVLEGNHSEVVNKQNTFRSAVFNVNTKKKILSTVKGIKSIIRLDKEKENVLFSDEAVYINSNKMSIFEKESKFVYEGNVSLNQGDIVLNAGMLEIGETGIFARGNVSLSFKSDEKEMAIKGGEVIFNSRERRIDIDENAVIKSDENILKAADIVVWFNDKNEPVRITGEKDINFVKEDLSGYSERVKWLFKEEEMILMGSPYIVRQSIAGDGGRTEGRELKIDLKTKKITILSGDLRRSETVIK
jgi:lipopolysaccharide transport protein LptA